MITVIMRLLGKEKLSNIKIKPSFKKHPPREKKMTEKWSFYGKYGMFSQPIIVDENNYLIDGYTTYIMAQALKRKYMTVRRIED